MSLNVTSNIGVIGYNNGSDGKFVTVANESNYFAYSTDGINWTETTIDDNTHWNCICYGNGKFVALSQNSNVVAYSTDGINWAYGNIPSTGGYASCGEMVCYGNGMFIASCDGYCDGISVTGGNPYIYSTDGVNWTLGYMCDTMATDAPGKWMSICYGSDKFVIIGNSIIDGTPYCAYTIDGINWVDVSAALSGKDWQSVCYGNGKFVAVANYSNTFAYSTDGITWTEGTISDTRRLWMSVCYGNGKYVAISGGYNSSNIFAYSTDGINWTEGTISDTSRRWQSVCYGNDKFVAIANDTNYFAYSNGGINWTESTISSTSRIWSSVCYGMITNATSEKAFNFSRPEKASTVEFNDKVILDSIVHHDSPMYLLINQKTTDNNFYIHSPVLGDITLTASDRKTYPVDSNMNRNCIGGKLHPLGNGYVAYSVYSNNMDATTKFADSDTGSLELITGVIKANPYLGYYKSVNGQGFYGIENDVDGFMNPYKDFNGKFVTVANGSNYFAYSTDGTKWIERFISSTNQNWYSVCYGNGKFVAVARDSNGFAYSTDGINWTEGMISDTSRKWQSICYGNGMFVVAAYSSTYFAYSYDGIHWTESNSGITKSSWYSVCYGNGKFVAVTWSSKYTAYSTDGVNWTETSLPSIDYWVSVCHGNGMFVTVCGGGYNSNVFAYSMDGITWTKGLISSTSRKWNSVCYGNGKFVTIAQGTNVFAYSMDGITWTEGMISDTNRNWFSVCYGNDMFISVASFDTWGAYSNDGIHWTEIKINTTVNYWRSVCYGALSNVEFSNNHTGISTDITDVNGISSMTTYTEQYTEDIYYIHYAWVDRASSSLVRYNILTRKIDTSSGIPLISNLTSYTTTFSIGTIAHPSFHKDKNGIHCAFYHGNTTYTKYYKLARSGTDDSSWSWGVDSNTYITNENISLMVNKNENNLQSSLAQSARRMYMVNSSDKLVEFKKTQIF